MSLGERIRAVLGGTPGEASLLQRQEPTFTPPARTVVTAKRKGQRMYAAAEQGRLVADWFAQSTSFDAELRMSLRTLRNRSRQLVRDNDYAKNAMRVIKNNVIGQGVRFQAQVKRKRGSALDKAINSQIEELWADWSKKMNCDVAGKVTLAEMQRVLMGAVPESGEVLVRKVRGRCFGDCLVPFSLEIIEADQLVEEWSGRTENGNEVRMGVEVNEWQRPVAYWLYPKHPGDYQFMPGQIQTNRLLRVPAEEVYHLYVMERPGATRGVPWMHSVARRLNNMGGYEEAEIIAARADASPVGAVESPDLTDPTEGPGGEPGAESVRNGMRQFDLSAGTLLELGPGEKFSPWHPTRPNSNMDPFMRLMLRGVAAGLGVSYESLSRDYSQSNYSSSRLALLDDRDLWRALQTWFVTHFLQEVYCDWLDMAVMSGALNFPDYELNRKRYHAVLWKPRGWEWIDPLKEVSAAKMAIRSGLQSQQDVLSAKGDDVEEVWNQRRRELDLAAELDLVFDTDPAVLNDKGQAQGATVTDSSVEPSEGDETVADDSGGQKSGRRRVLSVDAAEAAVERALLELDRAERAASRKRPHLNGHARH